MIDRKAVYETYDPSIEETNIDDIFCTTGRGGDVQTPKRLLARLNRRQKPAGNSTSS